MAEDVYDIADTFQGHFQLILCPVILEWVVELSKIFM
jgi:hypothetical protein